MPTTWRRSARVPRSALSISSRSSRVSAVVASYRLFIKASAAKEIEALHLQDRRRVVARIQALAGNPRPPGYQKLSGAEHYRVRQGSFRILYSIDDDAIVVTVVRVAHRRE